MARSSRRRPPGAENEKPSRSSACASRAAIVLWCRCTRTAACRAEPVAQNAARTASVSVPFGSAASPSNAVTSAISAMSSSLIRAAMTASAPSPS